jgi:copper chaperone
VGEAVGVTYGVGGMSCGGCVASVTKAVEKLGVTAAVDLAAGTVTVRGAADEAAVKKAVEGAGFDFLGRA